MMTQSISQPLFLLEQRLMKRMRRAKSAQGFFITFMIQDAVVHSFRDFVSSTRLPEIAYEAAYTSTKTVSERFYLFENTIFQIVRGVVQGTTQLGGGAELVEPIVSGILRAIHEIIAGDADTYVTDTYLADIKKGILNSGVSASAKTDIVDRLAAWGIPSSRVQKSELY